MNLDLPSTPFSTGFYRVGLDDRFLKALNSQNIKGRPPIWIMRQAGRYLPEYQKLRAKYSLEDLFRNPEHIVEITLQPIHRFPLDAAILFADILHVLLALGCAVTFPQKGGPQVTSPERLEKRNVSEELHFVKESICLIKQSSLRVPLIGFCGGPFTVAYYLLDKKPLRLLYRDPKAFANLLQMITDVSSAYLQMQVEAGVDAIQIFDTWAGLLPREELKQFALPYLRQLLNSTSVPTLIFSRSASIYTEEFLSLRPSGISFDGGRPLAEIRKEVPKEIAVQGNFPSEFLYAKPSVIESKTRALLKTMKGDPGFIVNLGHGILPDTPVEHVHAFIDTVINAT